MKLDPKPLVGLAGVLIATMTTQLNSLVSGAALGDIQGGLGISHDAGAWFSGLYITGEALGMSLAPWLAVTFTLRRFALFAIALCFASSLMILSSSNLVVLFTFRLLQGLSGGLTIPLLMVTALRALPPPIRLYGLAAYALTITFFPTLSTAVAALWIEALDWRFVFLQVVPLCAASAVLVWYGVPQDQPQYARIPKFDWRGALLILIGFTALTTLLQQGDRLDWLNSRLICVLILVSVVSIALLGVNEWFHELPLIKLQFLSRRNLAYAVASLFLFVIVSLSSSQAPLTYLSQVQGFKPLQSAVVTGEIAASQLILLPIIALVLNIKWVDARIVSFLGLLCIIAACIGDAFVTSAWNAQQFFLWQGLQAVGLPMVAMPLLLLATNTVKKPEEGPFTSALVNGPRSIAEATGVWLIQLIMRKRGGLHYDRLADQLGARSQRLGQLHGLGGPPGGALSGGGINLPVVSGALHTEAAVMTLADTFLIFAGLAGVMILVLAVLAVRTYPPRIVFKQD
jgi:DHA2 family multidrug resistance protein